MNLWYAVFAFEAVLIVAFVAMVVAAEIHHEDNR